MASLPCAVSSNKKRRSALVARDFWMQGECSVLGCEAVTSLTSGVKSQATVCLPADVVHRRKRISPFAALACNGEVGAWLCHTDNWRHPAPPPSVALTHWEGTRLKYFAWVQISQCSQQPQVNSYRVLQSGFSGSSIKSNRFRN